MQKWEHFAGFIYWGTMTRTVEDANGGTKEEDYGVWCSFLDGQQLVLSHFIDVMGDHGWEIAAATGATDLGGTVTADQQAPHWLYFKRPKD